MKEDYQARVFTEKKELDEKIVKLVQFLFSQRYSEVPRKEINRMESQLDTMMDYSRALRERIDNF